MKVRNIQSISQGQTNNQSNKNELSDILKIPKVGNLLLFSVKYHVELNIFELHADGQNRHSDTVTGISQLYFQQIN